MDYLPLDRPPQLAETYHVTWGRKGVMGICTAIYEEKQLVQLRRPKARHAFKYLVPWSDLRYTRKQEQRLKETGSPYPDRSKDPRYVRRKEKFKL